MNRLTRLENGIYNPNKELLFVGEVMNKLGSLEDLEDELGCPLDVVFKAFKEGFYFISDLYCKNVFTKQFIDRVLLYYSDELRCYCFSIGYRDDRIYLKDYGKTWALTKEELL